MLVNESHDLRVCELEHKNEAVRTVTYKLAMCRGSVSDDIVGTVSAQPGRWITWKDGY